VWSTNIIGVGLYVSLMFFSFMLSENLGLL